MQIKRGLKYENTKKHYYNIYIDNVYFPVNNIIFGL